MLVRELFPDLVKQIAGDLRRLKRANLAEQVAGLCILDRCRCGMPECGTFYTQPEKVRRGGKAIDLQCGVILYVARGKITEVETLDPEVTEALEKAIP